MPTETIHDQLQCANGVETATLSAWRDAQLAPDAQSSLSAHIADCPACQIRLAQFDDIASALTTQRELEPGDRILLGVRERAARLARQPAWRRRLGALAPAAAPIWLPGWRRARVEHGINTDADTTDAHITGANGQSATRHRRDPRRAARRRVWGGLGAVASVAAVLLLFVYVFHALGLGAAGQVHERPTPTGIAHAATATSAPTMTPTFTPSSPRVDYQTAWGSSAIVASVSNTIDSTHVFEVSAPTADGRGLLGYELTLDSSRAVSATAQAQAGIFNIASRTFTPIGVATGLEYPVKCCQDDGRFLVAADNSAPGATCGVCNLRLWSYDRTTGHLRKVATGGDYGGAGILNYALSNGYLVIGYTATIVVANLVTGNTAPLPGLPANDSYQLLAYTWPYIVYTQQTSGSSSVHAYDLATGRNTVIPQLLKPYFELGPNLTFEGMVVVGDTAYYAVQDSQNFGLVTLYELDHFMNTTSQTKTVARIYAVPKFLGANSRVIVTPDGEWDLAQHRFVDGPVLDTGGGIQIGGYWPVGINGRYLMYFKAQDSIPSDGLPVGHENVTVYDTSQLPVQ